LARLAESPFARCRFTVLDNHSTDDTPQVCTRFRSWFPDFHVVRHVRNIGANPNYLRAVEGARAPYTWVLADDDEFDFSDCDDVIAAIEEGEVDLISVGAPARQGWAPGRTSMGALVAQRARVFFVFTFMPNTIFRTQLFDDASFSEGYRLVDALYPHFPFVRRQVERDASLHVSQGEIVIRGGKTVPGSELYWFERWVRCCATIADRSLRHSAIYETRDSRARWLGWLSVSVAQERLHFPERVWHELTSLAMVLRGEQLMALVLVAPLALVPQGLYAQLKALRGRLSTLAG